jgi:peptide/nickel transport system permease protein
MSAGLATKPQQPIAAQVTKSKGPWRLAFERFLQNKMAIFGVVFLIVVTIMCVGAPLFTHLDPKAFDLMSIESPPGGAHFLGTDESGRDVWARLLYGGRVSLLVGFTAMIITIGIGVTVGAIAGYYGGIIDMIMMRVTEVVQTFPFMMFALTIVAIMNKLSVWIVIFTISVLGWAATARLVRGQFLQLREQEYVLGAKSIGCSDFQIIFKHIIPNALGVIIVNATTSMATFITVESALSFLGFGIPPEQASWGNMLSNASNLKVMEFEWWLWIPPGLAIILTVLSINFIGQGLRDAFDPKSEA